MCAWERCQVRLTSLEFLSEAGYTVIIRARVNLISLLVFMKIDTGAHKDWPVRPHPAVKTMNASTDLRRSLLNEEIDSTRHLWGWTGSRQEEGGPHGAGVN